MKMMNKMALAIFAVIFMTGSLWGQGTFENRSGATYTATCTAVLRVLDNGTNSPFTGADQIGVADTIDGIVEFAQNDANPQTVQAANYAYLFLSGSSPKTIPATGVIVYGDGTCDMSSLTGGTYDDLATYPYSNGGVTPTYLGEFTYAPGDTANIYPDDYNELVASGSGVSNVLAGDDITAVLITTPASSTLAIAGNVDAGTGNSTLAGVVNLYGSGTFDGGSGTVDFTNAVEIADDGVMSGGGGDMTFDNTLDLIGDGAYNSGAGATIFNDVVTLNSSGGTSDAGGAILTLAGTGDMTFNSASVITEGSLIIPDDAGSTIGDLYVSDGNSITFGGDDALLDVGSSGNMYITGTLNNNGNGLNLTFDCTSTVYYDDADADQPIMPTLISNPYGFVTVSGGDKLGGTATNYANDVALCADLGIDGPNLDMASNAGHLVMINADATIEFGDNTTIEEIDGKVTRLASTPSTVYYFNNAFTYANFQTAPDSAFTLDIAAATQPTQISYDNSGDYNRKVEVFYQSSTDVELLQLAIGYEHDEVPDATKQDQVRLVEGYNASNRGQLIGVADASIGVSGTETAATGDYASVLFDNQSSGNYLTFTATGTNPGAPDQVYNGNSIVMTTAPVTMISVRNGRWSDPGTWGGVTPTSQDHAQIAHVVYTGIYGTSNDNTDVFGNDPYDVNEQDLPGVNAGVIASYVEVDPNDVSGTRSVALVIGGEDDDMGQQTLTIGTTTYNHATFTGLWNKNTTANGWDGTTLTATTDIHGLYVMSEGAFIPTLRIMNGRNEGSVVNNAEIELGEQ